MGTYRVTDPDSGKTLRLTGDSPPTEQELVDIFSNYSSKKEVVEPQEEGSRGGLFGKVSESEYQSGKRNILGNIFERPGAAIRASIQAPFGSKLQAYNKAAVNPTGVPRFQDLALQKTQTSTNPFINAAIGMPASAAGLAADVLTNPADVLGLIVGKTPMGGGKKLGQVISSSKPGQAFGRFMNRPRSVSDITQPILNKFPRIMNDNWMEGQAKLGSKVADGIDDALSNAYSRAYKGSENIIVDSSKIDNVLLNSLDDAAHSDVSRSLTNMFGNDRVDTVEKAHFLNQILSKRTPATFYKKGGDIGKGGIANPKIQQMSAKREIKNIMYDSIEQIDPEAAKGLRDLDNFASEKIYPTLEKMRSIFGKDKIPPTEGIPQVYSLGAIGKASQRNVIRKNPALSSEMKKYISEDYVNDLKELERNSRQLLKDMKKYRLRQLTKGASALYLLNKGREQFFGQ